MLASELLRRLLKIQYQVTTMDVPVKNLDRDIDIRLELVEKDGSYYIDTMLKIE